MPLDDFPRVPRLFGPIRSHPPVTGVARHLRLGAVAVQEGLVDEDDPVYGK